jgi:general secretion pathway protein M
MSTWFDNLKRQEQLLLVLAAFLVLLYVVFIVILKPMSNSVDELQLGNEQAKQTLQTVQNLAQEYKVLQKNAGGKTQGNKSLTRIIDASVKKNQLTMKRFQPSSSGDVQVRFENVVFNHLIAWLYELEHDNAVMIKDLSVSPGSASGLVNVSVRLYQDA